MKPFAIAYLFGLLACQQPKQPEQSLSLLTDDVNYSVYSWYYAPSYWDFYLDYYINIDKSGQFKIMKRDSLNKTTYYTGVLNDTIGKLIDKAFSVDSFKANYKSDSLQNLAYSGYTYCFDYKKKNHERKWIRFEQSKSPGRLKRLSMVLETLTTDSATQVDTLELPHVEELKKFSAAFLGPLPKLEKSKFEPPRIKRIQEYLQ